MRTSKIFVASVFMLAVLTLLPSCMTTRTSVGSYRETEGDEYVYAKGKQCYLFWGLVPLGRTRVATPADGNCEVRTRYGFWDAFLSVITGGIFEMQSIRVYAKHPQKASPATDKQQSKKAAPAADKQQQRQTVLPPDAED